MLSLCHLGHLERGVDAIHDAIGYLASILFAQSSFPSGNWDSADLTIDLYSGSSIVETKLSSSVVM